MSTFAKDLGDLANLERLHSTHLNANTDRVLCCVNFQQRWVSPQFLARQTILPLDAVLSALRVLRNAGFIVLRPAKHGIIEAAPARFAA